MLDFLFKGLSSLASFAFPIFASYKALQQDDFTLIKPWLMYWVVIAIQLTIESYAGFVLQAVPFYQVIRFGFMLWLVLPQTQGASQLYVSHVQPFLYRHESEIDRFITHAHANARSMGVEYLARASHFVKEYVSSLLFGTEYKEYVAAKEHNDADLVPEDKPTTEPTTATSSGVSSYADILFSRFRYPPAENSYSSLQNLISGASSSIMNTLQHTQIAIPTGLKSKTEIAELRTKLMTMVSTLDERLQTMEHEHEQSTEQDAKSVKSTPATESASESEFDVVQPDEAGAETPPAKKGWFW